MGFPKASSAVGAAPSQLASMEESKGSSLTPSPMSRSQLARSSVSDSPEPMAQKGMASASGISSRMFR